MIKTQSRTWNDRTYRLGLARSAETIAPSAVQTSCIGIDKYADTAAGPFQSCCQSCWRSHRSGLSIVQVLLSLFALFRSINVPNGTLFAKGAVQIKENQNSY